MWDYIVINLLYENINVMTESKGQSLRRKKFNEALLINVLMCIE